jgi:hypothetical protein
VEVDICPSKSAKSSLTSRQSIVIFLTFRMFSMRILQDQSSKILMTEFHSAALTSKRKNSRQTSTHYFSVRFSTIGEMK